MGMAPDQGAHDITGKDLGIVLPDLLLVDHKESAAVFYRRAGFSRRFSLAWRKAFSRTPISTGLVR